MTKRYDENDYLDQFTPASRTGHAGNNYGNKVSLGAGSSTNVIKNGITTSGVAGGSEKARPTLAFTSNGLEFWGSSYSNLDDLIFTERDLLINGYGTAYIQKPFIKSAPAWLSLEGLEGQTPHQLLLDWKDFSIPPTYVNIDFWENIVEQAKAEGIKRIILCCGAGLGRTGTGLASLLVATGFTTDPEEAIDYIRAKYNCRAIETKQQELYIWRLVMPENKIPMEKVFRERGFPQIPLIKGESHQELEEESPESWYNWTLNNRK